MGEETVYYITKGPIRGACEHKHRNVDYAYHCLRHEIRAAEKEGAISDRRILAVDSGLERELAEREICELDYARRTALKKTVLKQEQRKLNNGLGR
ncbi:MAG: hypothetical protein KBA97_00045 [Methanothrix sp.]|nr:hypothetical protein [Methanothrix sp.]